MSVSQTSQYHQRPSRTLSGHKLTYHSCDPASLTITRVAELTPKPKGCDKFSSIHLVRSATAPELPGLESEDCHKYVLPHTSADPVREYNAIFDVASRIVLARANRASLLVFVGDEAGDVALAAPAPAVDACLALILDAVEAVAVVITARHNDPSAGARE